MCWKPIFICREINAIYKNDSSRSPVSPAGKDTTTRAASFSSLKTILPFLSLCIWMWKKDSLQPLLVRIYPSSAGSCLRSAIKLHELSTALHCCKAVPQKVTAQIWGDLECLLENMQLCLPRPAWGSWMLNVSRLRAFNTICKDWTSGADVSNSPQVILQNEFNSSWAFWMIIFFPSPEKE